MQSEADVVVVGGGIAGGALASALAAGGLSVYLLERQAKYEDLVRGEFLTPWGIRELQTLGLEECLQAADAWTLRWWMQWDEIYSDPSDVPVADLSDNFTDGVEGPVSAPHHKLCQALTDAAAAAGANVVMGARGVRLMTDGTGVEFTVDGAPMRIRSRLVVGAGGRYGQVAQQAGIVVTDVTKNRHMGGGVAVEGIEDWPDDTQAMGSHGDVQFFVFPQGGGRARLYLSYAAETQKRFSGGDTFRKFVEAFRLPCLPLGDVIAQARQAGRLSCFKTVNTVVDMPIGDGVVLIGDEAGMTDTVLGTGLANSLRDARMLSELLLTNGDWGRDSLKGYAEERRQRMHRLHLCADLMASLYIEFGPEAMLRRKRAMELIAENPAHAIFLLVAMAGPEWLPDLPFAEYLSDRLLAS